MYKAIRFYLIFVFSLLCLQGRTGWVKAHGGGTVQLTDAPAGPFLITVWTSPSSPRSGEDIHVTVGVEAGDRPVLDAAVMVQAMPIQREEDVISAEATTEQSVNKLLYEADLRLGRPGTHAFTVIVASKAGEGRVEFMIDVQQAEKDYRPYFLLAAVILLVAVVALRSRRRTPESQIKQR